MSDMPRVIQAARSGLSAALRVEPEMLTAIDGDNSTPANPEFFTSYTRTDLVDELIEVVRDKTIANVAFMAGEGTHEEFTVTSKRVVAAIAAIRGEGK